MKELQNYHRPAAVADLVAQVGVDPSKGLSRDDAMARRALYGANRVTPPINCPSWICCLLPCLLRTASMQAYNAVLPKEATVRRIVPAGPNGKTVTRRMRMDAMSLVYGDVVELHAGDLVSADMRVVECSADCVVDQSTLAADDDDDSSDLEAGGSSLIRKLVAVVDTAHDHNHDRERHDPLQARNVLLMASRMVRGNAVGVVVATGNATFWGQLLAQHQWPVASTSKRAGRVNKYPEQEQQQDDEASGLMDQKSNNTKELLV